MSLEWGWHRALTVQYVDNSKHANTDGTEQIFVCSNSNQSLHDSVRRKIFMHAINLFQHEIPRIENCWFVFNLHDQKPQLSPPMSLLLIFLLRTVVPLKSDSDPAVFACSLLCLLFFNCHTSLSFTFYGWDCQDSLVLWKPYKSPGILLRNARGESQDGTSAFSEEHGIGRSPEGKETDAGRWANSRWAWHARLAPTDLVVWACCNVIKT